MGVATTLVTNEAYDASNLANEGRRGAQKLEADEIADQEADNALSGMRQKLAINEMGRRSKNQDALGQIG